MPVTIPDHTIERRAEGYVVNTQMGEDIRQQVVGVQTGLHDEFGDRVWSQPPETLHVTLMDWLAPLESYPQDKQQLFVSLYKGYNEVFDAVLVDQPPILVSFGELCVSATAVCLRGEDDGSFNFLRQRFLSVVDLKTGTKPPPDIVHCPIARFTAGLALEQVEAAVASHSVEGEMVVDEFDLVRETVVPMLKSEQIKSYLLQ